MNFDNFEFFWQLLTNLKILTIFENFDSCWKIWKLLKNLTIFKTILQTCANWDTDYNSYNWELGFMTIFVTWQSIVTLDSIRNSCDVLVKFWWFSFFYSPSSPSLSRDMPNWCLAWNFHLFDKFSYRNTDCRSEKCLKRRPHKPCKAGQYKKVFILLSRHDGDKTIEIWLLKMIWGQKLHFWRRKWSFWTLGPINGAF